MEPEPVGMRIAAGGSHLIQVPDGTPTLRTAAAEALLSGALLCADVDRGVTSWTQKPNTDRFLKALEALREALS